MPDSENPTEGELRLAAFVWEALFLKRTPRTGYQFLGRGGESVAEHTFGAAAAAFTLAQMAGLPSTDKILKMALFHDLPEARTGDLNYMNKRYVGALEEKALKDQCAGLPFGGEILELHREWRECETREARLARDADQIDFLVELARHRSAGLEAAGEWIRYALKRLKTPEGKALAEAVLGLRPDAWWFDKDESFWVNPPDPTKADGGDGGPAKAHGGDGGPSKASGNGNDGGEGEGGPR
jgi:putative hydrolase of HD superfamily